MAFQLRGLPALGYLPNEPSPPFAEHVAGRGLGGAVRAGISGEKEDMTPDDCLQDAMQQDQAMHGLYEEWLRDEAAQAGYCQWLTSLETKPTSGGNGNKAKTCSVKNVASKTLVSGILPNILTRSSNTRNKLKQEPEL